MTTIGLTQASQAALAWPRRHQRNEEDQYGLSAIVCPVTLDRVPVALHQIGTWVRQFPPYLSTPKSSTRARLNNFKIASRCDLVFVLNRLPSQEIADSILNLSLTYPALSEWFRTVRITTPNLDDRDDVYLRGTLTSTSPYGTKAGPNLMFVHALTYCAALYNGYFLLMETDCTPMFPGWAAALDARCRANPEMWILGSRYYGTSPLRSNIARHINGNALYNIGSTPFMHFVHEYYLDWLTYWAERKDPTIAHDCAWEAFISDSLEATPQTRMLGRTLLEHIGVIPEIVNISGADEKSGRTMWSLGEVQSRFPNAAVVHGRLSDRCGPTPPNPLGAKQMGDAKSELAFRYTSDRDAGAFQFGAIETIGNVVSDRSAGLTFRSLGDRHGGFIPFRLSKRSFVPGDKIYAEVTLACPLDVKAAVLLARHGTSGFEGLVRRRIALSRRGRIIRLVHLVRASHDHFRVHIYLEGIPGNPLATVTVAQVRIHVRSRTSYKEAGSIIYRDQLDYPRKYGQEYLYDNGRSVIVHRPTTVSGH